MEPLVKFQESGQAAVLSYDVPEPTVYYGQTVLPLSIPDSYYTEPPSGQLSVLAACGINDIADPRQRDGFVERIRSAMLGGFHDPVIFPGVGVPPNYLCFVDPDDARSQPKYLAYTGTGDAYGIDPAIKYKGVIAVALHGWREEFGDYVGPARPYDKYITWTLAALTPERVMAELLSGKRLIIFRDESGRYNCSWVPYAETARPQLVLIEKYQMSSFTGNYGAGRTLQTFSLLPGEKTKLSIKSYTRSTTNTKGTSSILDSYTMESSNEFADAISAEQNNRYELKEGQKWHVGAEAQASGSFVVGKASAKLSANYKGESNSGRETSAKQMSNALSKHASRASSKRDIKVEQVKEVQLEQGIETGMVREIQNINVGRTLNFVFRQMNQEFITLLHFVDAQLGYTTGYPDGLRRVTLAELDDLIGLPGQAAPIGTTFAIKDETINDLDSPYHGQNQRAVVKTKILDELHLVLDHQGVAVDAIEEVVVPVEAGDLLPGESAPRYWQFKSSARAQYTTPSGMTLRVPGIILGVTDTVMRTGGVIVESLLGQGEAIDAYSKGLQDTASAAREAANAHERALVARKLLAVQVCTERNLEKAQLFAKLYPAMPPPAVPGGSSK